ncbi:MAG: acyl-CoA dehydrogenase [Gammaproteobacteria bacterium]|nr:acyl-CoA dehydrogenase [Gammaproteobacteria bacterium]
MQFAFTDEQEQLRLAVRRFLTDQSPTTEVRRLMATDTGYDPSVWQRLCNDLALAGVHIPQSYGGQGFSAAELAIVVEEMGRALLCAPYFSSTVLAATAILNGGSEADKVELLPPIAAGDRLAALAVTEPAGRWDASGVEASVRDGRLSGAKSFVVDGHIADLLVVAARRPGSRDEDGLSLYVVDATADGVSRRLLTTVDATRKLARIDFDGVEARLLGDEGAAGPALARTLDLAAIMLANEMVGGAAALLESAVEYANMRVQFGRAVGSFQAIKHRCADLLLTVELAKSAAYQAATAAAEGDADLPALASLAQSAASDAYMRAARDCIQIHGGIGFTWDNDTHLWYKRAKSSEAFLGDAAFHRERLMQHWRRPTASTPQAKTVLPVAPDDGAETAAAVAELRDWLADNWDSDASLVEWRGKLADSGWGMPTWPRQWFGRDLPQALAPAVEAEFARINAVGVAKTGIRLLAAATLLEHGNDAQKASYLRRILTGEDTWCQLFSEPGSGSDLAGATTRADFDGDNWIVNGQKVWTTSAHHADYGLLLARTDWDSPKHQGLSYFVLDMRQPGVEVRPLKQMNGHASFNQVFFTDAVIPPENQVGKTGEGWQIAITTLAHERRGADGAGGRGQARARDLPGRIYEEERQETATVMEPYKWYPQRAGRVDLVVDRANATGRMDDPVVRQEIAKLLTMARSAEWTARRARAAHEQGRPQGPEGSLGKLASSNVARLANHVHTMIAGADAMLSGEDGALEGLIAEILVSVPATSIAGGTDEIQRNIIAERVLGMPKEPRMDRGPFRDVARN